MKIIRCDQGSSEWAQARLGVVTASEIDALVSPKLKIRTGEGPRTYLCKKLSESIMGYAADTGGTWEMDQGNVVEQVAIPWYQFTYDRKVDRVGFCVSDDGRIGASPDGLVGEDGGVEIKSPQAPRHISNLMDGVLPEDHALQVQMGLMVTGRKWWDFVSYHRYLPPVVVRVEPDPQAHEVIREAIRGFFERFDAERSKITGMMQGPGRA